MKYQGPQSAETFESVEQWQRLITAFQKEESSLVKLIKRDQTVAANMHYFVDSVFAGLQDYSFRQENATAEVSRNTLMVADTKGNGLRDICMAKESSTIPTATAMLAI